MRVQGDASSFSFFFLHTLCVSFTTKAIQSSIYLRTQDPFALGGETPFSTLSRILEAVEARSWGWRKNHLDFVARLLRSVRDIKPVKRRQAQGLLQPESC